MSVEYSAVAAKLKAMHSRFLSRADYEEMIEKESVRDICAYLKSTAGYSDTLGDVNENDMHRGTMELMLEQDMLDEYVRLYSFVDKEKRDLLEYWFMGREIAFLKREIRYIYTHEERSSDEFNQGRFDVFFETHTKINRDIMRKAVSLSDCVRACEGTVYGRALQRAENLNLDFFAIGMLLDRSHYSDMWRSAHKSLKSDQIKLFEKLIGAKTDMLNLLWIYRGKRYYSFNTEAIFAYLLPIHHRVTEDQLRRLVNSGTVDEFIQIVTEETAYGALFAGLDDGIFPEENYRSLYNRLSRRIFVNNSESLVAVYAYFNLKEAELHNITSVIEGVRYGLNKDYIRKHIGI